MRESQKSTTKGDSGDSSDEIDAELSRLEEQASSYEGDGDDHAESEEEGDDEKGSQLLPQTD
jgi:hypothetical protein